MYIEKYNIVPTILDHNDKKYHFLDYSNIVYTFHEHHIVYLHNFDFFHKLVEHQQRMLVDERVEM